jgi:hypothetical protein
MKIKTNIKAGGGGTCTPTKSGHATCPPPTNIN